ncbi:MAG: hypothetical protein ACXWFY_02610 [Chthoniobacterales bacterium]
MKRGPRATLPPVADGVGAQFVKSLQRAVARGVEVRVLIDDVSHLNLSLGRQLGRVPRVEV